MDLIYTDNQGVWQGVSNNYTLDMAYGSDENDFELTMGIDEIKRIGGSEVIGAGSYIYVPNTEWGGVVDSRIFSNVEEVSKIKYRGRTWHGIMSHSILEPDPGESHLVVSGECNSVLQELIDRQGLGDVFAVMDTITGVDVNFQFNRYIDMYSGIRFMLDSVGMKLSIVKTRSICMLHAVPVQIWSSGIDDNFLKFTMQHDYRPINHLIGLGQGDMEERTVVNVYADVDGNVSLEQSLFGVNEITEVYNYSNAEDEELLEESIKKLQEYQSSDTIDIKLSDDYGFAIGDVVKSTSVEVNEKVTDKVSKIIVSIGFNEVPSISYKVGDYKMVADEKF